MLFNQNSVTIPGLNNYLTREATVPTLRMVRGVVFAFMPVDGSFKWVPITPRISMNQISVTEASDTWELNHKLRNRVVSVIPYDVSGKPIAVKEEEFVDNHNVRLTLSQEYKGWADIHFFEFEVLNLEELEISVDVLVGELGEAPSFSLRDFFKQFKDFELATTKSFSDQCKAIRNLELRIDNFKKELVRKIESNDEAQVEYIASSFAQILEDIHRHDINFNESLGSKIQALREDLDKVICNFAENVDGKLLAQNNKIEELETSLQDATERVTELEKKELDKEELENRLQNLERRLQESEEKLMLIDLQQPN